MKQQSLVSFFFSRPATSRSDEKQLYVEFIDYIVGEEDHNFIERFRATRVYGNFIFVFESLTVFLNSSSIHFFDKNINSSSMIL